MLYEEQMEKARSKLERLREGEEFKLKELFDGVEWTRLSKGDRLNFGRYFKASVSGGDVEGVEYKCKAADNSAIYIKKQEI